MWCQLPILSHVIKVNLPQLMRLLGQGADSNWIPSRGSILWQTRGDWGKPLPAFTVFQSLQLKIISIPKWHIWGWYVLNSHVHIVGCHILLLLDFECIMKPHASLFTSLRLCFAICKTKRLHSNFQALKFHNQRLNKIHSGCSPELWALRKSVRN